MNVLHERLVWTGAASKNTHFRDNAISIYRVRKYQVSILFEKETERPSLCKRNYSKPLPRCTAVQETVKIDKKSMFFHQFGSFPVILSRRELSFGYASSYFSKTAWNSLHFAKGIIRISLRVARLCKKQFRYPGWDNCLVKYVQL